MNNFPEIGYTPANLRHLISKLGMTQIAVAEMMGVNPHVLRTWLTEIDKSSHRDMPLCQWCKFLVFAQSKTLGKL